MFVMTKKQSNTETRWYSILVSLLYACFMTTSCVIKFVQLIFSRAGPGAPYRCWSRNWARREQWEPGPAKAIFLADAFPKQNAKKIKYSGGLGDKSDKLPNAWSLASFGDKNGALDVVQHVHLEALGRAAVWNAPLLPSWSLTKCFWVVE